MRSLPGLCPSPDIPIAFLTHLDIMLHSDNEMVLPLPILPSSHPSTPPPLTLFDAVLPIWDTRWYAESPWHSLMDSVKAHEGGDHPASSRELTQRPSCESAP